MNAKKFDKLSPECQQKVAENFEDNGIVDNVFGAENASEDYRRDEVGLEDMENPALTGGYAPGKQGRK